MEIFKSQMDDTSETGSNNPNTGFETMSELEAEHFGSNNNANVNYSSGGTHTKEGSTSIGDDMTSKAETDFGSYSQPADLSFLDFAEVAMVPEDEDLKKKMVDAAKDTSNMTAESGVSDDDPFSSFKPSNQKKTTTKEEPKTREETTLYKDVVNAWKAFDDAVNSGEVDKADKAYKDYTNAKAKETLTNAFKFKDKRSVDEVFKDVIDSKVLQKYNDLKIKSKAPSESNTSIDDDINKLLSEVKELNYEDAYAEASKLRAKWEKIADKAIEDNDWETYNKILPKLKNFEDVFKQIGEASKSKEITVEKGKYSDTISKIENPKLRKTVTAYMQAFEENLQEAVSQGRAPSYAQQIVGALVDLNKENPDYAISSLISQMGKEINSLQTEYGTPAAETINFNAWTPPESEKEAMNAEGNILSLKYLQEYADKFNAIDTKNITNENIEQIETDLSNTTKEFIDAAQASISDLVSSLKNEGKNIQQIRDTDDFKKMSTEIFTIAQNIKDKCNDIRIKSNELGYKKAEGFQEVKNTAIKALKNVDDLFNEPNKEWDITEKLTKNEEYAISEFLKDIDGVEAAAEALMKSAAFNGAENVKGGEYSEAWKASKAYKPSLKDILSTAYNGGLGIVTLATGVAMLSNPATIIPGIALIAAGSITAGKNVGQGVAKFGLANVSNKQQMFGTGNKVSDIALDVYNRGFEPANYGDPKSVGTYTESIGVGLKLGQALMDVATNPLGAIPRVEQAIRDYNNTRQGGFGGIDSMNKNIYNLLENFDKFNNSEFAKDYLPEDFDIETYTEGPKTGEYGIETEGLAGDDTYSGYVEQAKNSNLAEDYNRGLEKEVRETVSDKYCKIFKTMLDKEPDYIKKVLIAIPKMHSEKEW